MHTYALDDLGYNAVSFDGMKAKIVCGSTESLPPKIFAGAKEIWVSSNCEEVRITITFSTKEDVVRAEKAVKEWCQ